MSLSLIKSFTAAIGLALLTRICLRSELLVPRNQIPSHLINQPIHVQRDLLTPQIGEELLRLVETIGASDGYPTNVVDTSFYHRNASLSNVHWIKNVVESARHLQDVEFDADS